ncbi:YhfH family protein [Halobacillus litoralis]|nr:YhfH family protein [Halobacillus litoralis]
MKKQNNVKVACPQCGSEQEGHFYSYMMECDRCLSKKEE